jgi:hypothetical protein
MRIFAAILSFHLFMIATQASDVVLSVFSQKQECCSHCDNAGNENPVPQQQDNSCNALCNPLLSCGACLGFTFSFSPLSLAPIPLVTEHTAIYIPSAISEIALPIWQPPKIS